MASARSRLPLSKRHEPSWGTSSFVFRLSFISIIKPIVILVTGELTPSINRWFAEKTPLILY